MTVEADVPAMLPKRPTIAKETLAPMSPPPSPASPDHESIDDITSRIKATEDPYRNVSVLSFISVYPAPC
jgi:hypothetical protein